MSLVPEEEGRGISDGRWYWLSAAAWCACAGEAGDVPINWCSELAAAERGAHGGLKTLGLVNGDVRGRKPSGGAAAGVVAVGK